MALDDGNAARQFINDLTGAKKIGSGRQRDVLSMELASVCDS